MLLSLKNENNETVLLNPTLIGRVHPCNDTSSKGFKINSKIITTDSAAILVQEYPLEIMDKVCILEKFWPVRK